MDDICYNAIVGLAIPLTLINIAGTSLVLLGAYWLTRNKEVPIISTGEITTIPSVEVTANPVIQISTDPSVEVTDDLLNLANNMLSVLNETDHISPEKKEKLSSLLKNIPMFFEQIKDDNISSVIENVRKHQGDIQLSNIKLDDIQQIAELVTNRISTDTEQKYLVKTLDNLRN